MIRSIIALLALGILLAGCGAGASIGSVAGGECKVFERPSYVVMGKTQYDQDVADKFVESGVGGCHWARPQPRPATLDAPAGHAKVAAAVKPARRGVLSGLKTKLTRRPVPVPAARVSPQPAADEIAPAPASEPAPTPPSPPPPPPDPIDLLLNKAAPRIPR